jgi:hypothetical protein
MGLMRSLDLILIALVAFVPLVARAQLTNSFYASSCPNLESIVSQGLQNALATDGRAGASLLRVHFHDCFVQVVALGLLDLFYSFSVLCAF